MKIKKIFFLLSLFIIVLVISACSSNSSSESEDKGDLTIYTAFPEEEVIQYTEKFEEETGINVKMVRLSAGEALARLKSEESNPQASVWYGGPSDTFVAGAEDGLIESYQPEEVSDLPEQFLDEEETWVPIYVGPLGFAVSEDWAEENKIQPPESWEDLLKPEFENEITLAHPSSSGTAYSVYATLAQLLGEDESIDFMKDLDKNVRQYTKSGSAPAQQAGMGETGVGIAFAHDILAAKNEGYPIEITFPEEGTGYEVGAAALVKDGPEDEKENAKEFIDWAISKEAQDLYTQSESFRLPVNTEAEVPKGAVEIEDLETIDYDAVWAGDNRDELLDRFNKEVTSEDEAVDD